MNREDFPMLKEDIVYFDNGATTLKPYCVVEAMDKYYTEHTSNIHRGDYDAAMITNKLYDGTRDVVAKFINADPREVVFTTGTTMSINMVVFGYMKKHLKKGDEVLLTRSEHASNVLPWMKLSEEIGIVVKYMDLDEDYALTVSSVEKSITDRTKVISIAHVTNVIGDVRDVYAIGEICKKKGIYFCVDGAQSVPHLKVDFRKANMDFLSFSGHKMCGPTGVGILVGKYELLEEMEPLCYGGGMNESFEADNSYELKKYLLDELKDIPNVITYNKNSRSGILAFNIEGVFAQESSIYLNHYHIYVRAGNHCSKMLKDEINIKNTVRVSMYFYNTKEDVKKLVEALKGSKDIFKIVI